MDAGGTRRDCYMTVSCVFECHVTEVADAGEPQDLVRLGGIVKCLLIVCCLKEGASA